MAANAIAAEYAPLGILHRQNSESFEAGISTGLLHGELSDGIFILKGGVAHAGRYAVRFLRSPGLTRGDMFLAEKILSGVLQDRAGEPASSMRESLT